jgi:NADH dehydrogenase
MALTKHVVIVGGGFGGIAAARGLRRAGVSVTLVDRRNHHVFQPLLYQVAMAGLSPAEIAVPIRSILREQENVRVLLGEATGFDLERRVVQLEGAPDLEYDYLVLAPGSRPNYFGHDQWERVAPGLKSVEDATEIRSRVLLAFEAAEREGDPIVQRHQLTFVVIGAGPTGVELAGAIAELAGFVLARDFRTIKPDSTRVILVEGGDRVLPSFSPELSKKAARALEEMGVEVRTSVRVTDIDEGGVSLGSERIDARTVLWAAGVAAAPLTQLLGVELDRVGRVLVEDDCSLPNHPEVFCIGDAACLTPKEGKMPLPGVSPVAIQQGTFVAGAISRSLRREERGVFRYWDKGSMATIGRSRAIVELGSLRLSGLGAWLVWLVVHIYYLIDFRNRLLVLIDWAWAYFAYARGARLITHETPERRQR